MYNVKRAFSLLEKISFERIGGSKEEMRAAEIIKEEIEKTGVKAFIEEFDVDHSEIKVASLKVTSPVEKEIEATGVKMSGSTPVGGIEKEFVYCEDVMDANVLNVKDKIVLINGRMMLKAYKKLINAGAAGFICFSGSVYDDLNNSDLDIMSIREKMYELGKIPGVCIRAIDAENLVRLNPKTVKLELIQEEGKRPSRNVVCEIKGSLYPEQKIALTAHYDSVPFSSGAYDNATGSVGIMELFHHFVENPPKRTLVFIWCGSEEMGLLGSKAYLKAHENEIEKFVFCLNIDMIGVVLGKEIAVCTSEQSLVNYIDYVAKEIGVPLHSSQGVYSSDSTPFADKGVPSVSFARISPRGGAEIHSRKDVINFISEEAFDSSLKIMLEVMNRLDKAIVFPIPRSIPDNMKLELDYYNQRKERN